MKATAMAKRFSRKYEALLYITGMILYCLLAFSAFSIIGGSTPALSNENIDTPMKGKSDPVAEGVHRYESGDIEAAREALESAKPLFPSNPAVSYYLGVIYLQEGRRSDTISEWREYVSIAPDSEDAMKIRKYLTLLAREEAIAYARRAVAGEAALVSGPAVDNAVAITPFHNLGSEALGPLGKGMAAMLITDLSQVRDLQVVERMRLQALLQEMGLAASGVIDPETAPEIGKFLKSGHVVTGSLVDPEKEILQIVSVTMNTEETTRVDTRDAQGALSELYNLEKQIACDIIESLGRDCDSTPTAFGAIHTRSYGAFIFWSRGLDAMDAGNFSQARKLFRQAVDKDPAFDLAKDALYSTPLPEMSGMTALQMIYSLSGESATGVGTPPWHPIFRSSLKRDAAPPEDEDMETLEATLREVIRLAFGLETTEQERRAGDCLKMALGIGYPPYLVLKTMLEEGDNLELDPLCETASAVGVAKAVFARAARDAVYPSNRNIYDITQIARCPCLRGESGLAYTPVDDNFIDLPRDPASAPSAVSVFIP